MMAALHKHTGHACVSARATPSLGTACVSTLPTAWEKRSVDARLAGSPPACRTHLPALLAVSELPSTRHGSRPPSEPAKQSRSAKDATQAMKHYHTPPHAPSVRAPVAVLAGRSTHLPAKQEVQARSVQRFQRSLPLTKPVRIKQGAAAATSDCDFGLERASMAVHRLGFLGARQGVQRQV